MGCILSKVFRHLSLLIVLVFTGLVISCQHEKQTQLYKFEGETQGTYYSISIIASDSAGIQSAIDSLLHRFDSSASVYKPNSIISRMNHNDSTVMADETFAVIFKKAMEVSALTGGAFDITVGPLVNAWGFGLSKRMEMNQFKVDSLLGFVGYKKVSMAGEKLVKSDPRVRIDYNAIAQGYAVDLVAQFLSSRGINAYLVDIGGEVVGRGEKSDGSSWNVGIELPAEDADAERQIQAVVRLKDKALSTSGNYRKYYEEDGVRYSHTIDPSTGYPVKHTLLSVSVLAGDCMTADAFATAFMVMGVDKGKEFLKSLKDVDAYFIYSNPDGKLETYYSEGFDEILNKQQNQN